MERRAQRIEVGVYEDKVGFTMEYDDGERQHVLFAPPIARQLATSLLKVLNDLAYIERQMPKPTERPDVTNDSVSVRDSVDVRISPPREETP
jgi:hypothetical protein